MNKKERNAQASKLLRMHDALDYADIWHRYLPTLGRIYIACSDGQLSPSFDQLDWNDFQAMLRELVTSKATSYRKVVDSHLYMDLPEQSSEQCRVK